VSQKHFVLHLGLAKTGTTHLQRSVFPFSPTLRYVGKPHLRRRGVVLNRLRALARREPYVPANDRFFKNEALLRSQQLGSNDAMLQNIRSQFESISRADRLNLFSDEGYLRPTRVNPELFDRRIALSNLKQCFPLNARIDVWVTLRERNSALRSFAVQFWYEVERLGHDADRLINDRHDRDSAIWRALYSYFDYASLCHDLAAVFGPAHVHTLNYEAFKADNTVATALLQRIDPRVVLLEKPGRWNVTATNQNAMPPSLENFLERLADIDVNALYAD
jgi:hypothetical protein